MLAMEPEILVLDEPSSNLDPASRRELAEILTGLDITILMVTHDLPPLQLRLRALVMNGGAIAADGPTAELLADGDLLAANRLEPRSASTRRPCAASARRRLAHRECRPIQDRRAGSSLAATSAAPSPNR